MTQPPEGPWIGSQPTAPGSGSRGITITLLPGQLVTLAGGILVVVGAWLDWVRPDPSSGLALGFNAYDVPARFLFRDTGFVVNRSGPTIGWLVLLLGIVCIVTALTRAIAMLALPAGVAALVLAVWYSLRLRDFLDGLGGFGPSFGDALGFGVIMVAIGGIAAAVGGILSLTTSDRSTVSP